MFLVLLCLALALLTGTITAWRVAHADHIDREHLDSLIDLPPPWTSEAWIWLHTRVDAKLQVVQVTLGMVLLVASIVTFGGVMGLIIAVGSLLAGVIVGSRLGPPVLQVGHDLELVSSIVRTNAQVLRAKGDADHARAAEAYASRIDFLRATYGQLAPVVFAQLVMPSGLALLLESYFLPEGLIDANSEMPLEVRRDSPPRVWDDLDMGFRNWLRDEIHPLVTDPYERSRAQRLEGVRQELLAGGGTAFLDLARLQQIVAELRRVA